jgi:peptidoglycan/xylan/chitin deacetylase (PgdA/CDA1 family)
MKNKHTFILSFDVEEFTIPEELGMIKTKEEKEFLFKVGAEGLKKVLKLLKKEDIPATFFCTYELFCRYPELIQEINHMGSEVAIHAYTHKDDYRTMNEDTTTKKLTKAKKEMEKKLKTTISGFRGPGFRAPKISILREVGFVYDSSVHPTYIPGHYNNLEKKRKIKEMNEGFWEVPISVVPFLRLPFSWIWFRNLPLFYSKVCTLSTMATDQYTLLYFHPWECIDLHRELKNKGINIEKNATQSTKLALRKTGEKFQEKLTFYISWAKKIGTFKTIKQYLNA